MARGGSNTTAGMCLALMKGEKWGLPIAAHRMMVDGRSVCGRGGVLAQLPAAKAKQAVSGLREQGAAGVWARGLGRKGKAQCGAALRA